jgi:hypothetical protein
MANICKDYYNTVYNEDEDQIYDKFTKNSKIANYPPITWGFLLVETVNI